jgi:hypothetical protein
MNSMLIVIEDHMFYCKSKITGNSLDDVGIDVESILEYIWFPTDSIVIQREYIRYLFDDVLREYPFVRWIEESLTGYIVISSLVTFVYLGSVIMMTFLISISTILVTTIIMWFIFSILCTGCVRNRQNATQMVKFTCMMKIWMHSITPSLILDAILGDFGSPSLIVSLLWTLYIIFGKKNAERNKRD